jgi:hypothetical protein
MKGLKDITTAEMLAILFGLLTIAIEVTLTLIYAETFLFPQLVGIIGGGSIWLITMAAVPTKLHYTYPLRELIK